MSVDEVDVRDVPKAQDRPRVLCNTSTAQSATPDAAGAIWTLEARERQLDANLIRLRPGGRIERHLGPDLDVLMVVVAGTGVVATAGEDVPIEAGDVVWLPRRSERAVTAADSGLSYLTVHPRRPALGVSVR